MPEPADDRTCELIAIVLYPSHYNQDWSAAVTQASIIACCVRQPNGKKARQSWLGQVKAGVGVWEVYSGRSVERALRFLIDGEFGKRVERGLS